MKTLHIICGPMGFGKTHLRHRLFSHMPCVDILTYQYHQPSSKIGILRTYIRCLSEVLIQLELHDEVCLEHTLLKRFRRASLLKRLPKDVRRVYHVPMPSKDAFTQVNLPKRVDLKYWKGYYEEALEVFDMPDPSLEQVDELHIYKGAP